MNQRLDDLQRRLVNENRLAHVDLVVEICRHNTQQFEIYPSAKQQQKQMLNLSIENTNNKASSNNQQQSRE